MQSSKMLWSLCLSYLFLTACATTRLSVESDPPGADVFANSPGQVPRKVGQTPYTLSEADIPERNSAMQILVAKEGYQPASVLLPSSSTGTTGKISFKMEQQSLPPQCLNQTEALNKFGRTVAEVQGLIRSKQLDVAEKIMTELSVQYPGLSVVHDMLGNIYYLRRDFDKALGAYKKSRTLAPDNSRTQKMIQQIESIRSGAPSSSGSSQ